MIDHEISNKLFIQKIATICQMLDRLVMQDRLVFGYAKSQDDYNFIKDELNSLKRSNEFLDPEFFPKNKISFKKTGEIYKNFEKFLSTPINRRKVPDNLYLVEPKQAYYSDEINDYFNDYLNIIKLYEFFEKKADHITNDLGNVSLIFLGSKKLIISDIYTDVDIMKLNDIDIFLSKFLVDESSQGISSKEKEKILKKGLINFFKDMESVDFSQIIQDFNRLYTYLNDELDIYMSKFSYDDIRKEVEKEKVDFIVRLNKVFSDIQTQLIGVPVSVILAADKLKIGSAAANDESSFHGISLTNILVILAIGFYAVVLAMLIRNQNNTLEAIKDEMDHHESLFNSKHKGMAQKFQKSFIQIKNRYEHQRKMLLWVDILVCLAFGLIYLIAYVNSFSNLEFLLPIMSILLIIGILYFYRQYE